MEVQAGREALSRGGEVVVGGASKRAKKHLLQAQKDIMNS